MIKKYKFIMLILILCVGISAGFILGKILIAKTVSGTTAIPYFITQPLYVYSIINQKLYSNNPIERLTGYCALYDLHIVDDAFLYERYKQEESVTSKRLILQLLASKGGNDLLHFFDEVYELSDKRLQKQIVTIIKNQYTDKLNKFAQKHKIDAQWIHSDE